MKSQQQTSPLAVDRRSFLKHALVAGAATAFAPRIILAAAGRAHFLPQQRLQAMNIQRHHLKMTTFAQA